MNLSEYFYENWLDKLVTLISVIIGIVTAVGIVLTKILDCIKQFKDNTQKVVEKSDELKESNRVQLRLNGQIEELIDEIERINTETQTINENNTEQREYMQKEIDLIKKALYIAFVNSAELVKKGRAEQIAELLKNETEEKQE